MALVLLPDINRHGLFRFCYCALPLTRLLFLSSINSTTWEMTSRHRITYLAELEDDLEPFDAGVCCNLLQFCFLMAGKGGCGLAPAKESSSTSSPRRWETQFLRAVAKHDEECALEMDAL